ncbi:MAG: ADP-glyceromanno-heptose 6-epimerase [Planctomycetota bacterium]|nr:ADP-glyceromanno-heptose 6-epimerase [Planctomycetota bacterium]
MLVVTGADGFIGSNLVADLLAAGAGPVAAVDAYGAKPARYVDELKVAEKLERDELPKWLDRQGSKVRGVFHLGACSDTTATDRPFMLRNNVEYSQTLFRWCAQAGVPFVYASSAATYGDGAAGFDDEADPKALKPLNLYGESKQLFDLWALEQRAAPPRWAGLKYFNVYGPREAHKGRMASVALHAFRQLRAEGEVKLFESHREGIPHGGQKRDFVFVADAVAATRFFLETPASAGAPNGLYNVGTGAARSFADLARAVFAALGLEPRIRYIPMPGDLREKYQYFTQAATRKLRRAGFARPFASLETGVAAYVRQLAEAEALSS